MRINELKGYRKNPFFIMAANSNTMNEFRDKLSRNGFDKEVLGSGVFGIVFSRPGKNYVYKVFKADDWGYRKYLKYMLDNQDNPHVPKIIGKPLRLRLRDKTGGEVETPDEVKLSGLSIGNNLPAYKRIDLVMVKLERLEPLDFTNIFHDEAWDAVRRILDAMRILDSIYTNDTEKARAKKEIEYYKKLKPDLLVLLESIHNLSNADIDLHSQNVMMRGDTIVITDPYAWTMGPTKGTM
jgi:hypothetical protein